MQTMSFSSPDFNCKVYERMHERELMRVMLKERRRARQGEVKHRLQEFVEACELQTITSLNIN